VEETCEDYDPAIRAIVDAAPPLSDAQWDKLAALLDDEPAESEAAA
jgi:hypothetical protein